ncbi:hypothetical protein, partial [Salmonella sp. s55004]|uniref:hypothetical protein n=1 Tax=Salmonella sp. s55004 TaxID=3159675 RepID=UPI00397F9390
GIDQATIITSNTDITAELLYFTVPGGDVLTIGSGTVVGQNTLQTYENQGFNQIITTDRTSLIGDNNMWLRFTSKANPPIAAGSGFVVRVVPVLIGRKRRYLTDDTYDVF